MDQPTCVLFSQVISVDILNQIATVRDRLGNDLDMLVADDVLDQVVGLIGQGLKVLAFEFDGDGLLITGLAE